MLYAFLEDVRYIHALLLCYATQAASESYLLREVFAVI